jgi:hypothetical protein
MKTEVWYQWKELIEGRLVDAESNPMHSETPIGDFLFDSPEDARDYLDESFEDEVKPDWILVRTTYDPIGGYNG